MVKSGKKPGPKKPRERPSQIGVIGDQAHIEGGIHSAVLNQKKQRVKRQQNIYKYKKVVQAPPAPGANPKAFRESYLNRVFRQTCDLPLSGIDPKVATTEACQKMQLSAVYTGLFTQQPAIDAEKKALSAKRLRGEHSKTLSALELLNREKYLSLLGDPGSGKSTFVNFVALCLAGEGMGVASANIAVMTAPLPTDEKEARAGRREKKFRQPWDHGPLLPVRIVLRDLAARGLPEPGAAANRDTLWKFIEAELRENFKGYAPYLHAELQQRGGLILLDGLDEVPDANNRRLQVKQAVRGFVEDFPKCRVLATSRTYAYQKQEWKLEGFAEAVLSPFTPRQVSHFVEKWYEHIASVRQLNADETKGRAALLNTAIHDSERLSELAERPLLLTLMAFRHAWRGGSLPEKREQLYADAVELLLDQWESPKVVRDAAGQPIAQGSIAEWLKVDKEVVRSELNRLAFEARRDQPQLVGTADISQERLIAGLMRVAKNKEVNPLGIETYICDREGLLAARRTAVYAFPHRTFQEYLAACHLTNFRFPDEAADLIKSDPQRWREAVLLAGAKAARGTSAAVWYLAEALCFRDPPAEPGDQIENDCWGALLAAQTLLENERDRLGQASEPNAVKLERIRQWLLFIIGKGLLPPVDRALAGDCLSVIGDDRDLEELVTVPSGKFLMGDDKDERASPQHEVFLPGFKIGRFPVTNARYRKFINATGGKWASNEGLRPERSNCPAERMDWYDAKDFCEWLTDEWMMQGKIDVKEEVRLPTEAEWEKTARGEEGWTYPWGNDWNEHRCNSRESLIGRPCAVGMFPADKSSYGCMDMAGNVWEWTSSLWGKDRMKPDFKYPHRPDDGRENQYADNETMRMIRGGSWEFGQFIARCSYRNCYRQGYRNVNLGFRVVVSPVSPPSAL